MVQGVIKPYRGKFRAILLFGPPGSGKGTQAAQLARIAGHVHISSGDVFRGLAKESPAGRVFASYAEKGLLVPDDVTIEVWLNYVHGLIAANLYAPNRQLLILDGIPRTNAQVKLLMPHLELVKVIALEAAEREPLIERMKSRALIEKRLDDADEGVLKTRMEVYERQTAELLNLLPKDKLFRVNALQTPVQVLRDILVDCADFL